MLKAMYVVRAKPKNCTHHRFKTDKHSNIKIGLFNFGLNLTACAKVGSGWSMESEATKPHFLVDFDFYFPFSRFL
jgi:hypothetical protein